MSFAEVVRKIISSSVDPITPQDIREKVKKEYPKFYGKPAHVRNVERGHYKDLDHVLLAQIYILVRTGKDFYCNKRYKPFRISMRSKGSEQYPNKPDLTYSTPKQIHRSEKVNSIKNKIRNILENANQYHKAIYEA